MALRATTSSNKDGMHTPAKSENVTKNSLNCLRRNILTSTAHRPRAVSHAGLGLNDTDISEISSPSHPHRTSRELDSFLQAEPRSSYRRSVPLVFDEIVERMSDFNLRSKLDAINQNQLQHSNLHFSNLETGDLSSLGILRQSEMISHFDSVDNKSNRDVNNTKPVCRIPEKPHTSAMESSYKSVDANSSFDLSHFLSTSHKFTPMRPNSLPATKLDNSEFNPAESSTVQDMFKRDEEEFKKAGLPFENRMDSNLTFVSPCGEIRKSWVSPEKRSQLDEKRLTIGEYFKLKSSDLRELSQSLCGNESLEHTFTAASLPTGTRPEFIQGFKQTIDLTGNDNAKETILLDDTVDGNVHNTSDLDNTLVPDIEALSISTIAGLMDNKKGSDTVVRELLDLANKNVSPKKTPMAVKEAVPVTPKKAPSRLPRPNSKQSSASKPSIVRNTKGSGHLVCCDVKIRGPKVVANLCTLAVTVVNESADTLQCDLIDLADCPSYSITNQPPIMLLSKRKITLQGSIVFHQAGDMDVNVGVRSMDIRTKKKSTTAAAPLQIFVEPQIYLKTLYKDGINFGLHAEDTKTNSSFEITNLGPYEIPICITIEQDTKESSFFLMVPPEEKGGEIRYSSCMAFSLPGSEDRSKAQTLDIGIIFFAPSLNTIPGDMLDDEGNTATLRAQLVIEVEKHGEYLGLAPQERSVLARCPIEGRVGFTQLLVSHNTITLHPGKMQKLAVKNGGVVPLGLHIEPMRRTEDGPQKENSIQVDPSSVLLLPGEDKPVNITWLADPENSTNIICDLHLIYENDVADHVVTVECRAKESVVRERLPLKTTRPHVAWGSTRPGDTCKQVVSFQNTSSEAIVIGFRTIGDDHDLPFKILSENDEVTSELEVHFGPQQRRNLIAMFSPTRLGPAVADIQMLAKSHSFQHKVIPLSAFGGHSKIVLRQVSTSKGNKWITLKPDFGDAIVGNLSLYNEGTITAFVKITGSLSIPATESTMLSCTPDLLFVPPKDSVSISVALSGIRNVLSRTPSSEVKTLAAIHISSINEVTRRRLRRIIPTLSNKDLINFLKSENGAGMNSLVSHELSGEMDLVSEATLDQLNDMSGASACFLTKDLDIINVELRAEGTGAARTMPELDTVGSFVSIMDKTPDDSIMDLNYSSDMYKREWDVDQKEVTLQLENNYKAAIQVTNFTDKAQSLEIVCGEGLEVEPTHPNLAAYKTALIFISYTLEAQLQMVVDKEVIVYSKNDRVSVRVRVIPKPRHRMIMPIRKPLEPSFASCSSSGPPASPAPSNYSSSSSGSSKSWHSMLSGASSEDTRPTGVYTDTKMVVFPYTPKGHESAVTMTIFNGSNTDKKVNILPPGEPFWIMENDSFIVAAKWHIYVRLYFRPTIAACISGSLRVKVEGQEESITVQLQGLTDNH